MLSAPLSSRTPICMLLRITGVISLACWRIGQCPPPGAARMRVPYEQDARDHHDCQWRCLSARGRAAAVARRFPARRTRPHRYACWLRARRLRCLHGDGRRRQRALLPDVCGAGRRLPGGDGGRALGAGPNECTAGGFSRASRAAMWLLHARHADDRDRHVEKISTRKRRRDPRRAFGESVLLRHAEGNVLFDTGCHPLVAENPEARWGALARLMTPIMPQGEHVVHGLKAIGVEPDDIDVVICSHLHPDHCGCNAFFKRATFVIHEKEVAAARTPATEQSGYLAQEWDLPMKIDTIGGERDLFGDNRIVLVPLPGHTSGTTGALVALEKSGTFFLASDTVSLRMTLDTGVIPRNTWNAEALAKSLAEVGRIEKSGATIICGHDAAQWDTLRKGPEAYD